MNGQSCDRQPVVGSRLEAMKLAPLRSSVLANAACTLGCRRMPLKIAAPCSISDCTMFVGDVAGFTLADFTREARGAVARGARFAREEPFAAGVPVFNLVDSQVVNLLLTGRRRAFGIVVGPESQSRGSVHDQALH
jgi:hypothetical protein